MNVSSRRRAIDAAVNVATTAGFAEGRATVVQETNNVVVWLAPHPVIAKVGTWPHSTEVLAREVEVCAQLARTGAPVAAPIGLLAIDATTDLPVSLWHRLDAVANADCAADELANMLRQVHTALHGCDVELPSFMAALDHARATLFDDRAMAALPRDDLLTLREAFDGLVKAMGDWPAAHQPLHGEPHLNNVILTPDGPHLVDFEAVSLGPVEWDLASMDAAVANAFDVDHELLALLRLLNSARLATWGWAGADHPSMRVLGQHHIDIVKRSA